MARPLSLQVYVAVELGEHVRKAAAAANISVSEWLRAAIVRACEAAPLDAAIDRIARQSTFLAVGLDALLAGHPDPALRGRVHQAYARKRRQLGLSSSSDEEAFR